MNAQASMFDLIEGRRRRDLGKARATAKHSQWLSDARDVAVSIARTQGTVTADDVRAAGVVTPAGASYNVWGSVFNDDRFQLDGLVISKRPEAHGNLLRRWRLSVSYPASGSVLELAHHAGRKGGEATE